MPDEAATTHAVTTKQAVTEHTATNHTATNHTGTGHDTGTNGSRAAVNGHSVMDVPDPDTRQPDPLHPETLDPGSGATDCPPNVAGGVTDAWSAVVHDVRTLTLELADAGIGVVRQLSRPAITRPILPSVPTLPAITQLQTGWTRVEDAFAREVKTRLDRVEDVPGHPHATRDAGWLSPAGLLEDLLTASERNDTSAAREELYRALLLRLVPDEAKLLATLAEGKAYALLHVQTKSRTVLGNVSTVADLAGLTLPEAGETYIAHLLTLGLAEEGPEDEQLAGDYEALLGRARVRAAGEVAREDGRLGTRIARRTLRISRLGAELWLNCRTPAGSAAA